MRWHATSKTGYSMGCTNIFETAIRCLHGNPKTTYSELMVTARKAETKTEDVKEKVKVQSSVATEVSDSSKELGNQIAQLMAALNRAEQGTQPTSAPNSPRHRGHGRGRMGRNTPVHPSSHNGWTGLGKNTFTCSTFYYLHMVTFYGCL